MFRIGRNSSSHCYILESMEDSHNWGRYTFIGYDPQLGISCRDGQVQIRTGTTVSIKTTRPQDLIQQILEENKVPRIEGMPPFTGGLTGYFSYEFITYAEPSLHLSAEDDEGISDLDLMLFDKVIVFDNLKQKIQLIVNVRLGDAEENYNRACLEIRRMKTLIKDGNPAPENPLILQREFTPRCSPGKPIAAWWKRESSISMKGIFFRWSYPTGWKLRRKEACWILTGCFAGNTHQIAGWKAVYIPSRGIQTQRPQRRKGCQTL